MRHRRGGGLGRVHAGGLRGARKGARAASGREHRRHGDHTVPAFPGRESAITLWDTLQGAGYPEQPELDALAPSTRCNLLAENQIVRCPIGMLLGKAVERTVPASNTCYECPTPIRDEGRGTINQDSFVYSALLPATPAAP